MWLEPTSEPPGVVAGVSSQMQLHVFYDMNDSRTDDGSSAAIPKATLTRISSFVVIMFGFVGCSKVKLDDHLLMRPRSILPVHDRQPDTMKLSGIAARIGSYECMDAQPNIGPVTDVATQLRGVRRSWVTGNHRSGQSGLAIHAQSCSKICQCYLGES